MAATGAAALAIATVVYVVWPAPAETPAEQVVVSSPVFRPVTLSPPPPSAAESVGPDGPSSTPDSARYGDDAQFDDDVSMTRAVQRELKRARCYAGRINGLWTPATRKAMAEFTAIVNATLPVDRVDPVLLVLLESNRSATCSSSPGRTRPRKDEVASIDRTSPSETQAPTEQEPELPTPNDQGAEMSGEETPEPQTAALDPAASDATDEMATAAAVAAGAKAARPERRRVVRKYRQKSSFARSVSRGFRKLQRSFGKLF